MLVGPLRDVDGRSRDETASAYPLRKRSQAMMRVTIQSVEGEHGATIYQAVAGDKRSTGRTVGQALDRLNEQLAGEAEDTLVIVQRHVADRYFSERQRARLAELMDRWRALRDRGEELPMSEREELDALVAAELRAAADRSAAIVDVLES